MTRKLSLMLIALLLSTVTIYAAKGTVRIASDQEGAYIYVDGKKKAMTGDGFTSILLDEGEHTIKVIKSIDANYEYIQNKSVFVGEDSSIKLSFKLTRNITAQGLRLQKALNAKKQRWKRKDSVVIDTKLGLVWQDDVAAKNTKKSWESSTKHCQDLSLSGYGDWRLPSYDELLSIVDYDSQGQAIISSFENVASGHYWTSSEVVSDPKYAWYVYFKNGYTNYFSKSHKHHTRCVRK